MNNFIYCKIFSFSSSIIIAVGRTDNFTLCHSSLHPVCYFILLHFYIFFESAYIKFWREEWRWYFIKNVITSFMASCPYSTLFIFGFTTTHYIIRGKKKSDTFEFSCVPQLCECWMSKKERERKKVGQHLYLEFERPLCCFPLFHCFSFFFVTIVTYTWISFFLHTSSFSSSVDTDEWIRDKNL